MQAREHAFAKAVADEPPAMRLPVEVVTRVVLADRQKQVVYALDPGFVALDLRTGQKRWSAEGIAGNSLSRVGMWLVVHQDGEKQPHLTFIDPAKSNDKPTTCSPKVPIPPEAENVYIHPFDRAGQPYFYWRSAYHYRGGIPPSDEIEKRQDKAEQCGIMRLDVATCTAQSVSFDDFLWEPPEGRRAREGEKDFCAYLSPLLDFPAAAASAPKGAAGYGQFAPATQAPMLAVLSEKEPGNACKQVTRLSLEARDEASNVLWTHPLDPIVSICGPP